jgi:proline dehydrogenase
MFKRLWKRFWVRLSKNMEAGRRLSRWRMTRRAVRRFVAGEALNDALGVISSLRDSGLDGTLDHLGEDVTDAGQVESAVGEYCNALQRMKRDYCNVVIAVKLTQIGLAIDRGLCESNLGRILEAAGGCGTVEIDMEGSAYTEGTLQVFRRMRRRHENLGIAIQAYLYRSEGDIRDLLDYSMREGRVRVRLVKGAYDEPRRIAFPRAGDVNANYMKLSRFLFENHEHFYPAIATHNTQLIEHAKGVAASLGRERFEFQMLLGVRQGLQRELAREGYRVRVYVPYGEFWYPYLMRRIGERPANGLFLLKNLFR